MQLQGRDACFAFADQVNKHCQAGAMREGFDYLAVGRDNKRLSAAPAAINGKGVAESQQ